MRRMLSIEERNRLLRTIIELQELFESPEEIYRILWPLIIAAVGNDYFVYLDAVERQRLLTAYDEILNALTSAMKLLEEDIRRFKKVAAATTRY